MPGSSSWMPYAPQGVKGFDDDDDDDDDDDEGSVKFVLCSKTEYRWVRTNCCSMNLSGFTAPASMWFRQRQGIRSRRV